MPVTPKSFTRVWRPTLGAFILLLATGTTGQPIDNLLVNPGFEDLDMDMAVGDGWSAFGAASFDAFFGDNGHASLFPDDPANIGGVFQLGIPGTAGTTYQFDLLNTRIEENFDASLRFGVEFYLADDTTKIGESITVIDAAARLANGSTDGNTFSFQGTAPAGTAIVRPVALYDTVVSTATSQENVFIFDAFLSEAPAPGNNVAKNPGFDDLDANGLFGDIWGSFGNTDFNDFFGGNNHASLFADTAGNSGGFFQSAILGTAGAEYTFTLEDVRVETNFDADLIFGLEFYGDDDFNKIGESLNVADTSVTGDGLSFDVTGTAPDGTVYVRPVILFDNVNPLFLAQSDANAFIFETSLVEAVGDALVGDFDGDGFVGQADLNLILLNFGDTVLPDGFNEAALSSGEPFDGLIGQNELNDVLLNFGNGELSGPVAATIPEPTSFILLTLGGLMVNRRRGK